MKKKPRNFSNSIKVVLSFTKDCLKREVHWKALLWEAIYADSNASKLRKIDKITKKL